MGFTQHKVGMKTAILFSLLLTASIPCWAQKPTITITEPLANSTHYAHPHHFKVFYETTDAYTGNTSIGIFLHKNVPEAEKGEARQYEGALPAMSIDLPRDGKGAYYWTMHHLACMKDNKPTTCEITLPSGPYRIEVVLYDRLSSPLVGPNALDKTHILAQKFSGEFQVISELGDDLEQRIREAAKFKLMKMADLETFPGLDISRFLNFVEPRRGPNKDGMFCKTVYLHLPFEGTILACGSTDAKKEIRLGGRFHNPASATYYQNHKQAAFKLVQQHFKNRVDFLEMPGREKIKDETMRQQATYLKMTVKKWHYVTGYDRWLLVVEAKKAGGLLTGSDRFNEAVILKFEKGSACISQITSLSNALDTDLGGVWVCRAN